jgi:hypothetical protein
VAKANILNKQFEGVFSKLQPFRQKQLCKHATSSLSAPEMPTIEMLRVSINVFMHFHLLRPLAQMKSPLEYSKSYTKE